MYDVISLVFEIYYAAFCGYCLQYFYGSFLEYKRRERRWNGLCVAVSYTVLRLCVNLVLPSDYGDIRTIGNLILTFSILTVISLLFYKAVKAITGYLVITFMAVVQISFFIAYNIYAMGTGLNKFWFWCMKKGYIADENVLVIIVWITLIGLQLLMFVIFSILCYRSLKKIIQSFREKEYPIQRMELLFILAPSMAGYLICVLLRVIVITIENGMPELIYEKYPVLFFLVPAILILCLLTIIYGVKLFQDMIYLNRERNSRAILEKQVSSMQEQMAEMEHIHSGIRSMKHDMKNTLTVIIQLADKNGNAENTELHAYLSELNQTFDRLEIRFKTGNTVVDTLLGMKYHDIMRTIPDLQLSADKLLFPENLMIQSYDISVILGNALDNAIEACKKQKAAEQGSETFIRLYSFSKRKMLFIRVENSFDGEVIRRQGAEFPATTKPDKKVHGIGLTNIKNTAEKYHGGVDWTVKNKVFTLTVMLKNERSTQNEYQ
ncbi:MAG: GHKL domain-containing protein [Lachnospiraceae bacterium]|nr:GHKL domain-containing protein [Lachnospiraceae bacterium]